MVIIHIAIVWLQIKRETIKETQTRHRLLLHSAEYSSVATTIFRITSIALGITGFPAGIRESNGNS